MIADDKNKVLIGTPTKTGTHSLEAMVRRAEKDPSTQLRLVRMPGSKIPRHHHMLIPEDCGSYRRLITVRHPLDRLASLYTWLLRWPWQWKSMADEFTGLNLDEFVQWWLKIRLELGFDGEYLHDMANFGWWRSPNIWCVTLHECAEAFDPHGVIRLEHFEHDLKTQVRTDWGTIPHVNRSRPAESGGWKDMYSTNTIRSLHRDGVFDNDCEDYDYAF
jgi:hypothetical protein